MQYTKKIWILKCNLPHEIINIEVYVMQMEQFESNILTSRLRINVTKKEGAIQELGQH